jgi:hypothetical protein
LKGERGSSASMLRFKLRSIVFTFAPFHFSRFIASTKGVLYRPCRIYVLGRLKFFFSRRVGDSEQRFMLDIARGGLNNSSLFGFVRCERYFILRTNLSLICGIRHFHRSLLQVFHLSGVLTYFFNSIRSRVYVELAFFTVGVEHLSLYTFSRAFGTNTGT